MRGADDAGEGLAVGMEQGPAGFRSAAQLGRRKRCLLCAEPMCPRNTQVNQAIRPRARLTERLREKLARSRTRAIAAGNRAVSDVAG